MDTWGIRSGTFVVIYVGLLALTGVIVFVIRWRIRGSSDRFGLVGLGMPEIDPYEAAMLKGGEKLVLTTAACRLSEAGSLSPADGANVLAIAGELSAQSAPVERWVYSVVEGRVPGAGSVLDADAADPVLSPIRARLWALGLLLERRQARLVRLQLVWFLPVAGLGVARLIAGAQNHRPVGYLVVLMLLGAFAAYQLTEPPLTTLAGRRVLTRLEADHGTFGAYGFAADVALSGFGALWAADATLAAALGLKQGGGGVWGGGGCGGGGCGGGGCGG